MVQQLSILATEFLRLCAALHSVASPFVFALSAGQLIVAVLHYLIQCYKFRTVYGG